MSIKHLHYTLREIDTIYNFLAIENTTFYQRVVSRLIAMRTDDFITIGFKVNKRGCKDKQIKNRLNELQEFYHEFFKTQRDKYGAHFQFLDFKDRLDTWSEINRDKANFFRNGPASIYSLYGTVPDFIPFIENTPSVIEINSIKAINQKFNFEQTPNFSSDILSLTRPNSVGLIPMHPLQDKCATLNAIELLVDYEIEILDTIGVDSDYKEPLLKLFIVDLVSYVDNFYTRTDIPTGAKQEEDGLDTYLTIDKDLEKGLSIAIELKSNFKLHEHVTELRVIRNKACGHIDQSIKVDDLKKLLSDFDFEKFKKFYFRLKQTLKSIYASSFSLKHFLMGPNDKLRGVIRTSHMPNEAFDGQGYNIEDVAFESVDNLHLYEQHFQRWMDSYHDDSRDYFYRCFSESREIERKEIHVEFEGGSGVSYFPTIRLAHQWFSDKLLDPSVSFSIKIGILNLFIETRNGHPNAFWAILENTMPHDYVLRIHYLQALGYFVDERSVSILNVCKELFQGGNIIARAVVLLAALRIDISSGRNRHEANDFEPSSYTNFITSSIETAESDFYRIAYSIVLQSQITFGKVYVPKSAGNFYSLYFENCYNNLVQEYFAILNKREVDGEQSSVLINLFKANRFVKLVAIFDRYVSELGFQDDGRQLLQLLQDKQIEYSHTDNEELADLARIYFKLGILDEAVSIAEYLVEKNAHSGDYAYLLLDLYRREEVYRSSFESLKSEMLNNFQLSDELREKIELIEMD